MKRPVLVGALASSMAAVGFAGVTTWRARKLGGDKSPGFNSDRFKTGVEGIDEALFQSTGVSFTEGNAISFCDDHRIFPSIHRALDEARHSVHFDIYIWKPGKVGNAMAERVMACAARGVTVRILVDPLGSPGFDEELAPRLQQAGCRIHYFRPPRRVPFKLWGRNHRKIVIVDGRKGFTGGFGIADEWGAPEEGGGGWRDAGLCVEGPVVVQMQQAFSTHWLETGGELLPREEFERTERSGRSRAAFSTSSDVKGLSNARWVTQISICAAEKRLWIANAYFVPPPNVLQTLCERKSEGVDVRLLLPARRYVDHWWVGALQRARYPQVLSCGIRVWEYQRAMLHAKTILVDESLVVVGSINMDPLSQDVLEEGALLVQDPEVAQQLEDRWTQDLTLAEEIPGHRNRA